MNPSRRLFMANTAGTAVAIALSGCGGGGGGYGGTPTPALVPPPPAGVPPPPPPASMLPPGYGGTPPPPAAALSCGATAITGNHGHALTIAAEDVDSPIDMVYSIMGSADHNQFVTLTAAQLAQIKGKTAATVMSTMGPDGHTHLVTVNCA